MRAGNLFKYILAVTIHFVSLSGEKLLAMCRTKFVKMLILFFSIFLLLVLQNNRQGKRGPSPIQRIKSNPEKMANHDFVRGDFAEQTVAKTAEQCGVQALACDDDEAPKNILAAQELLEKEAGTFYKIRKTSDKEEEFEDKVRLFNQADISYLLTVAVDTHKAQEQRVLSVMALKALGVRGDYYLRQILTDEISETIRKGSENKLRFEYVIRTLALEGLESHRSYQSIPSAADVQDPYLHKLIKMVAAGQKMGRPILQNTIDQLMGEKSEQRLGESQ